MLMKLKCIIKQFEFYCSDKQALSINVSIRLHFKNLSLFLLSVLNYKLRGFDEEQTVILWNYSAVIYSARCLINRVFSFKKSISCLNAERNLWNKSSVRQWFLSK